MTKVMVNWGKKERLLPRFPRPLFLWHLSLVLCRVKKVLEMNFRAWEMTWTSIVAIRTEILFKEFASLAYPTCDLLLIYIYVVFYVLVASSLTPTATMRRNSNNVESRCLYMSGEIILHST